MTKQNMFHVLTLKDWTEAAAALKFKRWMLENPECPDYKNWHLEHSAKSRLCGDLLFDLFSPKERDLFGDTLHNDPQYTAALDNWSNEWQQLEAFEQKIEAARVKKFA